MTRREFEDLITRLESKAIANPGAFRFHTRLLAITAYLYVFIILFLTLSIIVGGVLIARAAGFRLALPLVVLAAMLIRSLWVKLEAPVGVPLKREAAPGLFQMVDDVRSKLGAPAFDVVQLDCRFNASVAQVPRLGIFGWPKSYLTVGLSLMLGSTVDDFKGVLAHEIGHLYRRHGKFGAWLARVTATWRRIEGQVEKADGLITMPLALFLHWFMPRMQARLAVLSRINEREANVAEYEVLGKEGAAGEVIRFYIKNAFLRDAFWKNVYARSDVEEQPPVGVYSLMQAAFKKGLEDGLARELLAGELKERTDPLSSHPCLSEQLSALGFEPRLEDLERAFGLAPALGTNAAEVCFGRFLPSVLDAASAEWQEKAAKEWSRRNLHRRELDRRYEELQEAARSRPLCDDERLEVVYVRAKKEGDDAVLPEIRELAPRNSKAAMILGTILIKRDDPEGLKWLTKVAETEPEMRNPARKLMFDFYQRQGDRERAMVLYDLATEETQEARRYWQERYSLTISDRLASPELGLEVVETIRQACHSQPLIDRAFLVKRLLRTRKGESDHVLVVWPVSPKWKLERADYAKQIAKELTNKLIIPKDIRWFVTGAASSKLRSKVKRINGAEVYRRPKRP